MHDAAAHGSRLAELLDRLIGCWRARTADEPLSMLQGAWPSPLSRAEEWQVLRAALRDITGLAPDRLTAEEAELLGEAQRLLHRALRVVGQ